MAPPTPPPKRTDEELDFLLARGKMSGAAHERVLDEVLRRARPRRARWPLVGLGGAALAAAAAVALWVRAPQEDAFRAKGGAAGPSFEAVCLGSGSSRCPVGDTLLFRVANVGSAGYVGAYATKEGSAERIWYFPDREGAEPEIRAVAEAQVVGRGVTLGPEHAPGRYVVHLIVTRGPAGRDALLAPRSADRVFETEATFEVTP
jgi:hypothetical protein